MRKLVFAVGFLVAATAGAGERFSVIENIDINAPAAEVWQAVNGFDALDAWHPAVTKTEMSAGDPTLRGGVRRLTIGDGAGTVIETLTAYDPEAMSLSYVINETDIIPVKDYASTIKVMAINDGLSLVIWSSDFIANPPDGKPDSVSSETITAIYLQGLENLKSMVEQ